MRSSVHVLRTAALVGALLAGPACGSEGAEERSGPRTSAAPTEPQPDHPVVDQYGALLRLILRGGGCETCSFELALYADGLVTYVAPDRNMDPLEIHLDYDARGLIELMTGVEAADLISGRADCRRDVDGNAPVLTLGSGEQIDTCCTTLDPDHPVIALVEVTRVEAVEQHRRVAGTDE